MLVLTAAFVAFALALTAVVVSVTAIHLDRKRLADLADATALAAADAVAADDLYAGGARPEAGGGLALSDDSVHDAAVEFLAEAVGPSSLDGVVLVDASSPDGRAAHVELAVVSRPVLVSWVTAAWSGGVTVRAGATARAW
ncbi:hypothetical protein Slu03_19440 [Sediminihabitans luteus]|nr:hypothetical protein Slu03_19440 [Sediminihabitans luteus]